LTRESIFCSKWHNVYPTWRQWSRRELPNAGDPFFGAKLKAWSWRRKMLHLFHFLQSDMVFGVIYPFSWLFDVDTSEERCPTSMFFHLTRLWRQGNTVFPSCGILIAQFKFQAHRSIVSKGVRGLTCKRVAKGGIVIQFHERIWTKFTSHKHF